jgi:isoleucyl-tRNA synthetase
MAYDYLEIEARWGTILGEDNERMSKSRGNVVNPDDVSGFGSLWLSLGATSWVIPG